MMSDIADKANESEDQQFYMHRNRKQKKRKYCIICAGLNDRMHEGYAVCTDCVETGKTLTLNKY